MDHLAAIHSGEVTRTTVIGLRKAINADARRSMGLSVSSVAPKLKGRELNLIEHALREQRPRVVGQLHDTGLKLLRSPRYKKRLARVRDIVDNLTSFHLVAFDRIGRHDLNCVPVFEARGGEGRAFIFRNIPWQSGGEGPEVLEG